MSDVRRSSAISELPVMYAVALRLRDAGADEHTIAVAVDIDDDQVIALVDIADRKLASLMA